MSIVKNQSQLNQSTSLQNIKVARSQGGTVSGQLMKGFLNEAHMKTVTGSIPSKFETIVSKQNPKKSFNSTSKRFFQRKQSSTLYLNQGMQNQINQSEDTPGPGYYENNSSLNKSSISFSKRGYNGFVSGTQRNPFKSKYDNNGPGPGTYDNISGISTTFTSMQNSNSQIVQNDFKKQVYPFNAISRETVDKQLKPGPGDYDPQFLKSELGGRNAFWSNQLRLKDMDNNIPGVGQYQVRQNIGRKVNQTKNKEQMQEADIFQMNNQKYLNKLVFDQIYFKNKKGIQNARKLVEFVEDKKEDSQLVGDQDTKIIKQQPQHMFKHNTFNRFGEIETPIEPINNVPDQKRFNNVNLMKEMKSRLPNPSTYELKHLERNRQKKQYLSGSSFMSETIRQPYGTYDQRLGPNMQQNQQPKNKKSYHLNLARRWVQ